MHDALRSRLRADEGRSPEPTAGIMDSQSVKAADTVGRDSRGYDSTARAARRMAVGLPGR